MSLELFFVFYVLLFVIAFLYASVGHGGASGYLVLGSIFELSKEVMRPAALLLNLFVSFTAFIQFYRAKYFNKKIFFPLVITSVPMAFWGGTISLHTDLYKLALGILLIIPVCRFLFFQNITVDQIKKSNVFLSLLMGAAIGFVSGVIGIGGGIILSPLLLLLKWTDQKQTAAISALFIFVNSLAGLLGQFTKGIYFDKQMIGYILVAFLGGSAGAYFGAIKFNQAVLKILLSLVLLIAAIKLIFT